MKRANEEELSWVSAHLFYTGKPFREQCDRVILDVVESFVRNEEHSARLRKHFFIRYGKSGAHVRFRLEVRACEVETVRSALESHVARSLKAEMAGSPVDLDEPDAKPSALPCLWWIPYVPETARYGGDEALKVAEEWFWHSSDTTLSILREMGPLDLESRFGIAVAAMVVLLRGMAPSPEHAAEVMELHREHWLTSVGDDWSPEFLRSRFDAGFLTNAELLDEQVWDLWVLSGEGSEDLPAPFDRYAASVGGIAEQLRTLADRRAIRSEAGEVLGYREAVNTLAPIYLHMMNNRLGVYPVEEAYLAHMLARTLERALRSSTAGG